LHDFALNEGREGRLRAMIRLSMIPLLLLAFVLSRGAWGAAAPAPLLPDGYQPKAGEVFRDCVDCADMVVVPAGDFEMGSTDSPTEMPPHHVVIGKPFAIGRYAVTFDEWDMCVTEGGCKAQPTDYGWGHEMLPVINVSWDDAEAFVAWMSKKTDKRYRLPSEAEWEYAARAGTTTPYWWGREIGATHAKCVDCGGDPAKRAIPVGSFLPNAFGLFDTAGNSAEWVEDCWNDSYRGAPSDGSAWTQKFCRQRVLRGGSFANKATALRSAARFHYDQSVRYYTNGFRVVRDLP
jgi:formylglycine-generating enzyme required for sulfatase activity